MRGAAWNACRLVNEVKEASNLSLSPVSKERFDELKTFVSSLESSDPIPTSTTHDTDELVQFVSSLESSDPIPTSTTHDTDELVQFVSSLESSDPIPTCTAQDTDELMQSPVAGSPAIPPYFPKVETTFISESNMRFYSPVHGVDVSFKSLPPGVKEFELQVSVLDPSLFKQSDDLELCTMVVEIKTIPQSLQFEEETISVSIPHCAVISCSYDAECLSICTLPDIADILDFSEGEEIKADFGNGCCAQFNISHFTLFAGVREKRKGPRFMNPVLNTREQHNTTSPAKRFMSAGMLPVTSLQPVVQSCNSFPVIDMFSKLSLLETPVTGTNRQLKFCLPSKRSDTFSFVVLCYLNLSSMEQNEQQPIVWPLEKTEFICQCNQSSVNFQVEVQVTAIPIQTMFTREQVLFGHC